jgi:hypothetical protein
MLTESRKIALSGTACPTNLRKRETQLTDKTEELAGIHFSILLTAKWEAAEGAGTERRAELSAELVGLRTDYYDKIDEIAMSFGVQKAIDAMKSVERMVQLPLDMEPSLAGSEARQLHF